MNKKLIISMLILFLFMPSIFAETIILKSGKTIDGKIVERTRKSVKVDIDGIPITYYFDDIESIDGKKTDSSALPESIVAQISEKSSPPFTESFVNKKWGYSFKYPATWEKIPNGERQKGMAMGLRLKEFPELTIELQRGEFPDDAIEGKENLRQLVDTMLRPTNDKIKQEAIEPITLSGEPGYHVVNTFKKAVIATGGNQDNGMPTMLVTYIMDSYFVSPVFSSNEKDKRFFHIQMRYELYQRPDDYVNGVKFNDELTNSLLERNKIIEKYLPQAKEIINSFQFFAPANSDPDSN